MLSHSSLGADRSTFLYIYGTLILSKCDYGAAIYSSASQNTLNKLNTIHHAALCLATGAFQTSSVTSLLYESEKWSLDSRRKRLILNLLVHLRSSPNTPAFPLLLKNPKLLKNFHFLALANVLLESMNTYLPPLFHGLHQSYHHSNISLLK